MLVVLKIARFVYLLLVALLAGLLVEVAFVEVALLDLPASVYAAVQKPKHEVFEPVMPIFVTLVIASGLLILFLMRREFKSLVFALTLAGVLGTVALMICTVLVNVSINA